MSTPLISFIVPVYNKEKYLKRCLDSLLHHGIDYEVIIIDDCSQDSSALIAKGYAADHMNIYLHILPKNKGVGNARNVGVNLAQGEYLIFIDSDDWCSMMAFEKVQELLEHHNYPDCAIFSYNRYQDGDYLHNTIPNQAEPHNDYNALVDNDAVMSLFNKGNICASPWNKVYKRSFWLKNDISWPTAEELKELQVEGSEDFSLIPYVLYKADNVLLANSAYYNYDLNQDSASLSVEGDRVAASVRSGYLLRERFEHDPSVEVTIQLAESLNSAVFNHFYYFFMLKKDLCSDKQIVEFSTVFKQYMNQYKVSFNQVLSIQRIREVAKVVHQEMTSRDLDFDMLDMFEQDQVKNILYSKKKSKKTIKNVLSRAYKFMRSI